MPGTPSKSIRITVNGTGFAADYTAQVYGMMPHKNGVDIALSGVTSGRRENAERFAAKHGIAAAYANHADMLAQVRPHIDNIACANYAHGPYTIEAAQAGVPVIVVEKPLVIWPGYAEGRQADAATRKDETLAYLSEVLDAVRSADSKLLYAENFVYFDGVRGMAGLMAEAATRGKGRVLDQWGVCAHQGSHAPAYDTPEKSGGGALFNKACHPLGPILYLKQLEGILRGEGPVRPRRVSAVALQVLKGLPPEAGEHFRVMQNVDDFGRITIVFEDNTVAEVLGHDLSISGIRNELSVIMDCAQYSLRVNPSPENELFLPDGGVAGSLLFREKLPTPQGTSFPRPNQFHAHGYVNEASDAVDCALEPDRRPQSGPLMAWDTMAVLMAAYESAGRGAGFVDIGGLTSARSFTAADMPDPSHVPGVFQHT